MALVKTVRIDIFTQPGTSKEKLDALAKKADELAAKHPEVTVEIRDAAALLKLEVLKRELRATSTAAADAAGSGGIGGLVAGLGGLGSALGPLLAAVGPGGAAGGLAVVAGTVAGLAAGLQGIIPAVAAAGLGIGAFGLLAIPTFKAVSGALGKIKTDTAAYDAATTTAAKNTALAKIKAAWAALTPGQAGAVRGIQALGTEFGKLSRKLEPLTLKVLNDGLKIANTLLPDLLPFAQAAGTAIDGLLKGFDKFASSPGFKTFLKSMLSLTGPAITTIGEGLGKIAVAVGKLLLAMMNPDALRLLKYLLDGIALAITGLAWAFQHGTPIVIRILHDMAGAFDFARHEAGVAVAEIRKQWEQMAAPLKAAVKIIGDIIKAGWDVIVGIVRIALDAVKTQVKVTWDILVGLFRVFMDIIQGHWKAAWDQVKTTVQQVWNAIFSFLKATWNTIRTVAEQVWNAIVMAARTAWSVVSRDLHSAWSSIINWFTGIPGKIVAALRTLGGMLSAWGHNALNDMWTGIKNMWATVEGWFGGLPSKILHALGIHSAPGWAIDAGKHVMFGLLQGLAHGAANVGGFFRGLATDIGGVFSSIWGSLFGSGGGPNNFTGGVGGAPGANAALARRMMPAWASGSEWAAWNAVAMRESGWSSTAVNPTSGAAGIAQRISGWGPGYQPGNAGQQIGWMINYILGRYGDPRGAWAHELAFGWYDRGGFLPQGLSLALNTTGSPEPVGGGNVYIDHVTVNMPHGSNGSDVVKTLQRFNRQNGPIRLNVRPYP